MPLPLRGMPALRVACGYAQQEQVLVACGYRLRVAEDALLRVACGYAPRDPMLVAFGYRLRVAVEHGEHGAALNRNFDRDELAGAYHQR